MAKSGDTEIMSSSEMKALLMVSKRQPVNCAIGLTKDKEGVILLDKKAKPRKLAAMIKKEAASKKIELDMASIRFGRAEVDTDVNASLVQFIVNKEAPGTLRPKLLESLKKAGFQKCEISVDTAIDNEPDEDEQHKDGEAAPAPHADAGAAPTAENAPAGDAAPAATAGPAPAPGAAPEQEAGAPASPPASPQAATPASPQGAPEASQQAGAPDAATLTKRVTDLVKRMMAGMSANPAGGDAMKTAAVAAQKALQGGDLASASKEADTLERLLTASDQSGAAGASGKWVGPAIGSPVIAKAQATWVATRKKLESEIEKLHAELQSVYKDQGVIAELEKTFRAKVEPMMANFDHTLSDKLGEMSKNTDPAGHTKLVGEVNQMIEKYKSFLTSDPLIAKLDSNPFVPLTIEKTLTASLAVLSKALA